MAIVVYKDCKEQMMDIENNIHNCSETGASYRIGSIVDGTYVKLGIPNLSIVKDNSEEINTILAVPEELIGLTKENIVTKVARAIKKKK